MSVKLNLSENELIYFSMGPWDMEQDDPWESLRGRVNWSGDLDQSRQGRYDAGDEAAQL